MPVWPALLALLALLAACGGVAGSPEDAMTAGDGTPNDGVPNDGVLIDGVPNDGVPNDGVPNDGVLIDGTPDDGATNSVGIGDLTVTDSEDPPGTADSDALVAQVEEILAQMTVAEMIGQVLMPAVSGQSNQPGSADAAANTAAHGAPTPSEIVALHHLGGLIYLPDNIVSADQLRQLSESVQASARADTGIPLLISIDQEGGRVSRLTDEVSAVPSAAELSGQVDEIREAGYVTGQQVAQQGINVVLAPVADVVSESASSFISDRSYGSDPEVVAEAVGAAIEGLQQSGVAAAVKHWPGHGATSVDSHDELPTVDVDLRQWDQREAVPFRAAFDRDVAAVLVGHLALPRLDPSGQPATVSPLLIEDLLRQQFGYDGVVMTDALNMGAVERYDPGDLVVAAFQAGNDLILMPPSTSVAVDALTQAVEEGRISEERLARSVRRILRLKLQLGLLPDAE